MKIEFSKQARLFLIPTIMLDRSFSQIYFYFLHFRIIVNYATN